MKDVISTSLRFEKELIDRIKADAKRDKRSITGQVEYMLEKYYEIIDAVTPPIDKAKEEKEAM